MEKMGSSMITADEARRLVSIMADQGLTPIINDLLCQFVDQYPQNKTNTVEWLCSWYLYFCGYEIREARLTEYPVD